MTKPKPPPLTDEYIASRIKLMASRLIHGYGPLNDADTRRLVLSDADFLIGSPAEPGLLATIDALRAEHDQYKNQVDTCHAYTINKENEALRERVAELEKEADGIADKENERIEEFSTHTRFLNGQLKKAEAEVARLREALIDISTTRMWTRANRVARDALAAGEEKGQKDTVCGTCGRPLCNLPLRRIDHFMPGAKFTCGKHGIVEKSQPHHNDFNQANEAPADLSGSTGRCKALAAGQEKP